MELQQNLDLIFDVDAVLRGQGADAFILYTCKPSNCLEEQEHLSVLRQDTS
jgi:hypothetical protein